jgi:hypothetical protein
MYPLDKASIVVGHQVADIHLGCKPCTIADQLDPDKNRQSKMCKKIVDSLG